jgi:hypothetical protein
MKKLIENHFWFHRISSLVFCTGIFLHVVGLVCGRPYLIEHIYTPNMDAFFAVPMTFAAVCYWWFRGLVFFSSPVRKVFYYWTAVYLTASVPLHIRTVVVQDTSFIFSFPSWYSYFIIPVMALLSYFSWTTRFKPTAPVRP